MECESFFHTSGYVETEVQLANDLEWLLAHPADHTDFIGALKRNFPRAVSCYEIGCGAGSLLAALRASGYEVRGIEPNPWAVRHVLETYNIPVKEGRFDGDGVCADIVLAIDVLEHVAKPRQFFETMIGCVTPGGGIAVRVPTIDRHQWHSLFDASDHERRFSLQDPFCDTSVHITNFSTKGLLALAGDFGWVRVDVIDNIFLLSATR